MGLENKVAKRISRGKVDFYLSVYVESHRKNVTRGDDQSLELIFYLYGGRGKREREFMGKQTNFRNAK